MASQLTASQGPGSIGAGSEGLVIELKNTSGVECYLQGYPGLQMLSNTGAALSTTVHWGSYVTVPPENITKVTLASNAIAYFMIGFPLGTGYGTDTCPTSSAVEITPPNNTQLLKLSLAITPFGGTQQNLKCGEITASPVLSSMPAGF